MPKRLLIMVAALMSLAGVVLAQQQPAGMPREAILLDVDGAIGPATTEYVARGIETAAERDAALIILRLDTPGGLATSMRDINREILASPVPVITYVAPSGARAASAGTYIVYASHLAAMAPGTNIGAATPVQIGGGGSPVGGDQEEEQQEPADASARKATNDAVASIRALAEIHGRNPDWAERAVREAASLPDAAALETGVVEIVARDIPDLLAQAHGREVRLRGDAVRLDTRGLEIVAVEPNWRTRLLAIITNPNVAYILLLVGIYGIVLEFLSPGTIFSGVIGAIALLVGLFALNLLPTNFAGLGLIVLGIGLIVAEAFTPSFGIFGIGGAVALATGSMLLFDTEVPEFSISLPVILTATGASVALLLVAAAAAVRAHRRRVVTGESTIVGSAGEVMDWSGSEGWVLVHGERWHARAAAPLVRGQPVHVVNRKGLTLVVEPAPDAMLPE
ncbi:NfeD family protein [Microvirga roseola]|uniref:NfeD family protein n=1 Tax=Microvirga roseola TaxID=2883126 RepID=UPI0038991083